jgi:hypothetical protein
MIEQELASRTATLTQAEAKIASDREALAPLRTTTREDLTASASLHARTEAVGAFAMQVARLISALHAELAAKFALKQAHGGP